MLVFHQGRAFCLENFLANNVELIGDPTQIRSRSEDVKLAENQPIVEIMTYRNGTNHSDSSISVPHGALANAKDGVLGAESVRLKNVRSQKL
jgi:hypothetical protein